MKQWINTRLTAGILAGLVVTGHAAEIQAAELKEGSVACRNERALSELLKADKAGDSETRKWLFDGYACIRLTETTPVEVLSRDDQGIQHLRTVKLRRNIDLWIQTQPENS
ncbi:MAG: hypothetical protein QNJ40_09265 [Xanthomonadales bacterium]|nr:hypothetical protein [Xanthomonadales bacterium]